MDGTFDTFHRPLRSLRLSITDRCNLRCGYCMPEESYTWLPKRDVLTYEEFEALVRALVPYGIRKLRLTGGEPLLRRDIADLVRRLAAIDAVEDLALTTNAIFLDKRAAELRDAGLGRLTVSLDTLRPTRFAEMTRRDELARVHRGIQAAADAGFRGTKLNAVVMRAVNDDELLDLLAFGREHDLEVRFIEYMDVGGATRWSMEQVVPKREMLERIEAEFGPFEALSGPDASAPATRYRLANGQVFGIIASTTEPFCATCDRARMTADGRLFTCLYARTGSPIAPVLREHGAARAAAHIAELWNSRADRGAEARHAEADRDVLVAADELRDAPHLEMHTRGG